MFEMKPVVLKLDFMRAPLLLFVMVLFWNCSPVALVIIPSKKERVVKREREDEPRY